MSSVSHDLIVPADYGCLALVDPEAYEGFVDEYWELDQLERHICEQAAKERIVAWGCVSGNWRVRLTVGGDPPAAVRGATGTIRSSGQLLVTSWESITMAAQFDDVRLPEPHERESLLAIPEGRYVVEVGQTFEPSVAESREVFDQATPHFRVNLRLDDAPVAAPQAIPWFPMGG